MIKGLLTSLLLFSVSTAELEASTNINFSEEVLCLARNIYFEARNQSVKGQIAIAQVTLNRVNDPRFPNSICSVVTQARKDSEGNLIRHQCQFSWYCDGKSDTMPETKEKELALHIAKNVILGYYVDLSRGATHYHATYVSPYWRTNFIKVSTIDDHVFYRWDRR